MPEEPDRYQYLENLGGISLGKIICLTCQNKAEGFTLASFSPSSVFSGYLGQSPFIKASQGPKVIKAWWLSSLEGQFGLLFTKQLLKK